MCVTAVLDELSEWKVVTCINCYAWIVPYLRYTSHSCEERNLVSKFFFLIL